MSKHTKGPWHWGWPSPPAGLTATELTDRERSAVEVIEFDNAEDFADSLAGDLELQPVEPDDFTKRLMRAGFVVQPSARSAERKESKQ